MTINADEYKSSVGLKDLYIAEITSDCATAYAADTPAYFAPASEAKQDAAVSRVTQYADDQPFDVMSSEGETTITLTVTNIPIAMLALITGRVFDVATGRMFDNAGTPPYFALGFRSKKSSGTYRYYWYMKGRFDMPSEEKVSQSDKPDPKTTSITYTAIKTIYEFDLGDINDGVKRVVGDEDTTNFSAASWFSQVQTPVAGAISAISATTLPIDNAVSVAIAADITITTNNALLSDAPTHVMLLDEDLAPVVCVNTLSASLKVITVNPTGSLTNSKDYTLVLSGITDIYGQVLADTVITFTTVAA